MRTFSSISGIALLLLAVAAFTQQAPAPTVNTSNPDRIQLEKTLQQYLTAYSHKNFQELLTVWPDLGNQKKEAERIRRHFEDGNVSEEQMSVEPLETDAISAGALIRATRTEQFVKTERTSSIAHGDLNMGNMPVQDPGLAHSEKKKPVKKTDTVWIKFHRVGDSWTIASISSQKPQ